MVRVPGVAFGMLTLAVGQMFFLTASRSRGVTGGADGMTIEWPSTLFGLWRQSQLTQAVGHA
jgi:branched-chain amino acid transport system permease protein